MKNKAKEAVVASLPEVVVIPEIMEAKTKTASLAKISVSILQEIDSAFFPHIEALDKIVNTVKTLSKDNPNDCEKAKRAALDLGSLSSKMKDTKKERKDGFSTVVKYIDNLFNVVETKLRLTQADAKEVADYHINLEKQRIAELVASRRAELEEFVDSPIVLESLSLADLDETAFSNLLFTFKSSYELAQKKKEEEAALALQKVEEDKRRLARKDDLFDADLWRFFDENAKENLGVISEKDYLLHKKQALAFLEADKLEQERLANEAIKAKITQDRIVAFTSLGVQYDGEKFSYDSHLVTDNKILEVSETAFLAKLESVTAKINKLKEKAAKELAEENKKKEKEAEQLRLLKAKLEEQAAAAAKILADKAAEEKKIQDLKVAQAAASEKQRIINYVNSAQFTIDTPIIENEKLNLKLTTIIEKLNAFKKWAVKELETN